MCVNLIFVVTSFRDIIPSWTVLIVAEGEWYSHCVVLVEFYKGFVLAKKIYSAQTIRDEWMRKGEWCEHNYKIGEEEAGGEHKGTVTSGKMGDPRLVARCL
jgi:hypothetical protein